MKAVRIDQHFEFFLNSPEKYISDIGVEIIYDDDYWILRTQINRKNYLIKLSDPEPAEKHVSSSIDYEYYVGKRNSSFGHIYRSSFLEKTGGTCAMDSLVKDYLNLPSDFYPQAIANSQETLVLKDEEKGTLEERIRFPKRSEFTQDSVYYHYQKKHFPMPFFNKSTRAKNMNLVGFEAIFMAKPNGVPEMEIPFPPRKWLITIKEIKVPELQFILSIIDRFKHDSAIDAFIQMR